MKPIDGGLTKETLTIIDMPANKKTLRDGRTFWSTKNGFVKHVTNKKGVETIVSDVYYKKLSILWRKETKMGGNEQ